jgi:hypothetical protein
MKVWQKSSTVNSQLSGIQASKIVIEPAEISKKMVT